MANDAAETPIWATEVWNTVNRVRWSQRMLHGENFWPLKTRLRWLKKLDKILAKNKDRILDTVAKDKKANPHQILLTEYTSIRWLCQYYLRHAEEVLQDENRSRWLSLNWSNKKVVVRKMPLGVVGIISPHNHPFALPMGAVITALLVGNGVVLKPSSDTPATADLINELIKKSLTGFGYGCATGIFDLLRLKGPAAMALVECPLVDKIHFTGSTEVGIKIRELNAKVRMTPPTLELGGSNAAIVLEDANIRQAARAIVWARFASMSCNGIKRVFAIEPVYKKLCREIERQVAMLEPQEATPIPEKEMQNFHKFFDDFYLRNTGGPLNFHSRSFGPTVVRVEQPDESLLVLKEETFVPILPVVKVENECQAVTWANKTQYGLGASVFTKNKKRFKRIAKQLECGVVSHNDAMTEFAQSQVPFTGWKNSGWGSSHGPEGLLEFVRPKTVIEERWPMLKVQLYPWKPWKTKWLRKLMDLLIKLS